MTKRTRTILLLVCAVLFFLIAPFIVLYSMGYRIDFEHKKIVATGGIYVRVIPEDSHVSIDAKIKSKAGIFLNYVFEQSLLPGSHAVEIKKDGYFDYRKTLEVKEKEVVKLENVILFKQHAAFSQLSNNASSFSLAPDNITLLILKTDNAKTTFEVINTANGQKQAIMGSAIAGNDPKITWASDSKKALAHIGGTYVLLTLLPEPIATAAPLPVSATQASFNPQNTNEIFFVRNGNLYSNLLALPIISNVVTYQKVNQNILYLASDGFLFSYNINNKTTDNMSLEALPMNDKSVYRLENVSGKIILQKDEALYVFNSDVKIFENGYGPVKDFTISPDGQKMLYYNDHEILFSFVNNNSQKVLLNRFSEQIKDAYWINSDYVLFLLGDKIMISEIDTRGNINMITLPTIISITDKNIKITNPQIFLNPQDGKLYILTQNNLIASEKLLP